MTLDIRVQNLRRLISEYGQQRLLADAAGMNPSHLSQILTGRRGLGENLARRIEETLGLPHLWLDQGDHSRQMPLAPSLREEAGDYDLGTLRLAREIRSLPLQDRALFQRLLRRLLNAPVEARKTR
ncbi:MAG: helix-turn-helix domain-containing protein [Gammaproteobacteria bacterium]